MGASSSVYRHCNHGTWATCWWFSGQPLLRTDSSFVLLRSITYEGSCQTISTKHGLAKCGLRISPPWFAWHQISRGIMPSEDAVDGSTRQTHATSNSILPARASAGTSCLMQIGVGWRVSRTIMRHEKEICNCWFELPTMRWQIWRMTTNLRFGTSTIPLGTEVMAGKTLLAFPAHAQPTILLIW